MPKKPRDDSDIDAIAKAVQDQLPGWRLVRPQGSTASNANDSLTGKTVRGVSLDEIRRKFLPNDQDSDAPAAAGEDLDVPSDGRRSVLVEPSQGGAPKVADIKDGKIRIVQG